MFIIGCLPVGIDAIGKDVRLSRETFYWGQVNGEVACLPVGHGCNIPFVALALRHYHILTHHTVKGNHLVIHCRYLGDEVGTLLVLHVLSRTVGKHLQGSVEESVHCHLMHSRTLAHRMVVVAEIL